MCHCTFLFKAPDRNPANIKIQGHLPHQMDISWEVRRTRTHLLISRRSLKKQKNNNNNQKKKTLPLRFMTHRVLFAASLAHRTQWPWPRVQGELQEGRCGRRLEGTSCQKALVCREEHVHLHPVRNQNPEPQQPRLGPRAQDCERILGGRW